MLLGLGCAGFEERVQTSVGDCRGHRRATALTPSSGGYNRAQVQGAALPGLKHCHTRSIGRSSYALCPLSVALLVPGETVETYKVHFRCRVHLVFPTRLVRAATPQPPPIERTLYFH